VQLQLSSRASDCRIKSVFQPSYRKTTKPKQTTVV